MQQVGMVGMGLLGAAIAHRLRLGGFAVAGYDPDATRHGAVDRVCGSLDELVESVEALVVCLPDSTVTAGMVGRLARPGLLVLDATTGSPAEMASFGEELALAGTEYLDCTVAASSKQVRQGEAMVLAGGTAEGFERAGAVLVTFAERMFHTGGWGAGARMKLVVNLALGLQRAVLGEALGFASACGIDEGLALEVLKASPAYAKAMDVKGARMLERRYGDPDARLRQHHKDVRLILAEPAEARLPLTKLHEELLAEAERMGYAEEDNSAIREVFRRGHLAVT